MFIAVKILKLRVSRLIDRANRVVVEPVAIDIVFSYLLAPLFLVYVTFRPSLIQSCDYVATNALAADVAFIMLALRILAWRRGTLRFGLLKL